eukprot:252696-Rhodomonas_salina.1
MPQVRSGPGWSLATVKWQLLSASCAARTVRKDLRATVNRMYPKKVSAQRFASALLLVMRCRVLTKVLLFPGARQTLDAPARHVASRLSICAFAARTPALTSGSRLGQAAAALPRACELLLPGELCPWPARELHGMPGADLPCGVLSGLGHRATAEQLRGFRREMRLERGGTVRLREDLAAQDLVSSFLANGIEGPRLTQETARPGSTAMR